MRFNNILHDFVLNSTLSPYSKSNIPTVCHWIKALFVVTIFTICLTIAGASCLLTIVGFITNPSNPLWMTLFLFPDYPFFTSGNTLESIMVTLYAVNVAVGIMVTVIGAGILILVGLAYMDEIHSYVFSRKDNKTKKQANPIVLWVKGKWNKVCYPIDWSKIDV